MNCFLSLLATKYIMFMLSFLLRNLYFENAYLFLSHLILQFVFWWFIFTTLIYFNFNYFDWRMNDSIILYTYVFTITCLGALKLMQSNCFFKLFFSFWGKILLKLLTNQDMTIKHHCLFQPITKYDGFKSLDHRWHLYEGNLLFLSIHQPCKLHACPTRWRPYVHKN